MIGIDTNVLVRILTQDDAHQLAQARRFVARHCTAEEPGFVNRVVAVELVWVLESLYDEYSREQIATAIESLLSTATLQVEDNALVRSAIKAYRAGADFADALIAAVNAEAGCNFTATFDAAATRKNADFVPVK